MTELDRERQSEILSLWFGDQDNDPARLRHSFLWWKKDPAFDLYVRENFEQDLWWARRGEYDQWKETPQSCLAFIVLTDQFSRNIYRDKPQAYAADSLALAATLHGMSSGLDKMLSLVQRVFFYMPLMHAENMFVQERSLACFTELYEQAPEEIKPLMHDVLEHARKHAQIVFRFGRYPHRNGALGRRTTREEKVFLRQPGSTF